MPTNQGPFLDNEQDPIQGMDVKVTSVAAGGSNNRISGAFTSVMFKIVSQTETYLTLDQRVARQLTGEVIFVWAAEQGWLDPGFIANAFGSPAATGIASGRPSRIPRQNRFHLDFLIQDPSVAANYPTLAGITLNDDQASFNNTNVSGNTRLSLRNCRTDTLSFGVTAGRHVVATSYQGTAEGLQKSTS